MCSENYKIAILALAPTPIRPLTLTLILTKTAGNNLKNIKQ